ncbi:hypothetical protein ABZP36_021616 [Zizania latifolia]
MSRLTVVFLVGAAAAAALLGAAVDAKIVDGLRAGFYNKTCPEAEGTIRDVVNSEIGMDRTIAAGIIRIFFHDCFITTQQPPQTQQSPPLQQPRRPGFGFGRFIPGFHGFF